MLISTDQVRADCVNQVQDWFARHVGVVEKLLLFALISAESDNDAMDIGFAGCTIHPPEGSVSKIDMVAVLEECGPNNTRLLALCDRIRRYERNFDFWIQIQEPVGENVPSGDVVEETNVLEPFGDCLQLCLLFLFHCA
ncbi:hypothetical protein C5B99_04105 [Pseudoclavibacter sp. Z016]|nr:hypothetical protein C5B99_04105 [Pseudoclavibacter sp. Z016]